MSTLDRTSSLPPLWVGMLRPWAGVGGVLGVAAGVHPRDSVVSPATVEPVTQSPASPAQR